MAEGIARLVPPGSPIAVGPARLYDAFIALGQGGHIDLEGAGSPLAFDLATGEMSTPIAVYCVKGTTLLDGVESGLSTTALRRR